MKTNNKNLILNLTNLGKNLSGIGTYSLNLIRELAAIESKINFIVYFNKSAAAHIERISFPSNINIKWITKFASPDYKFKGHFVRLIFSNIIALKHPLSLIFCASQLEISLFRKNQIIMIHDIIPLLFKKYHKKQYHYFKYILPWVSKRAKFIITPSLHTKRLLVKLYKIPPIRIQHIPNGINKIYKNVIHVKDKSKLILYSGRISPMKNISSLFKSFELIKDRIPHKLYIVGEGKEELLKEVKSGRMNISQVESDRVVLKGQVTEEEMRTLLTKAEMLVFPSLYEGFGLPPLEAMACGCPVLVSNVSSLPEVCGEAVYYIDPNDIENLALGMYRIIVDKKLSERLINSGFQRSKLFDWKKSAKGHIELFHKAQQYSNRAAKSELIPLYNPNNFS